MVYWIIKTPVNNFIYSTIPTWIVAFILALFCSFIISMHAKKIYLYFFKSLESYDYILNTFVLNSCFWVINYFSSIVYMVTAPWAIRAGWTMEHTQRLEALQSTFRYSGDKLRYQRMLTTKGNSIYHKLSRIEPIAAAMKRDLKDTTIQLNSRQIGLYDSFIEHVINTKGDLKNLRDEVMIANGAVYGLHREESLPQIEPMPLHWDVFIT